MDPPSLLRAMQRKLQQKNVRLNARRRLLFKRQHIHRNNGMTHYSQLFAQEALRVRSSLTRLQRLQYSDRGDNVNVVGNVKSLKI